MKHLNFHISGQKIQPTSQVKYLVVTLQDDLHWAKHLGNLKKKLCDSVGLLSKIRHYVPKHLLRTLYYSLFKGYLCHKIIFHHKVALDVLLMKFFLLF